jgi:hypothetical protein
MVYLVALDHERVDHVVSDQFKVRMATGKEKQGETMNGGGLM